MKGPCCLLLFLCVVSVDVTYSISTSRIWTISIPKNLGGLGYIEDGIHKGVLVDLVDAVCAEGNMDCRIVKGLECWKANRGSRSSGGRALFGHWCDACTNNPTVERFATFKYSISLYKRAPKFIYVLKGRTFDVRNVQEKIIGTFTKTDTQCFARNGVEFSHDAILYHRSAVEGDIILDLQNGKIDGFFAGPATWTPSDLEIIEPITDPTFFCNLDGPVMMSRKDSHFTANWNVAATKLRNTPKWSKICSGHHEKHGHKGKFLIQCKE